VFSAVENLSIALPEPGTAVPYSRMPLKPSMLLIPIRSSAIPRSFAILAADSAGRLALNAWVVREGHVREGDPVILVRPEPDPGI